MDRGSRQLFLLSVIVRRRVKPPFASFLLVVIPIRFERGAERHRPVGGLAPTGLGYDRRNNVMWGWDSILKKVSTK